MSSPQPVDQPGFRIVARAMAHLAQAGGVMEVDELARALGMTSPQVGPILLRAEEAGFVRRTLTTVSATDAGVNVGRRVALLRQAAAERNTVNTRPYTEYLPTTWRPQGRHN